MENPHVKIGILCLVPETTSFYVQACFCADIGGSVGESLTAQRLQRGFCCNIMTDFCQKLGCHVSDFIMSLNWETASLAGHGMIDGEGGATDTRLWSVPYVPSVAKVQCVPEFTFVQEETMLFASRLLNFELT